MSRWHLVAMIGSFLWSTLIAQGGEVCLIEIKGAIGPATAGYVARAITEANRQSQECLVVQLDTPGGLLDSTKEIVHSFYASSVPIIVYVAPSGANATSAGCIITLASDVAAMAPGTTIGAAHPVSLGGEAKPDEVMKEKLENHVASYIESIARKRQRNVEWATDAVRKSASITAEKAQELKVIELVAKDMPDLLRQLDGREISGRHLNTTSAKIVPYPMLARERVFQTLWRPEVMFLLMLIAVYGIIGELSNPGSIFPGVVGVVALILSLYMGAVLPVTTAGIALLVLSIGLFVADAYATTHGVLTAGGIAAFLLGAFMLFDPTESGFRLPWNIILPAALVTAGFFAFVVGAGLRAQLLPVRTGARSMIGQTASVLTPVDRNGGTVFVEGESWSATSDTPVDAGGSVEITGILGLRLQVKPKL